MVPLVMLALLSPCLAYAAFEFSRAMWLFRPSDSSQDVLMLPLHAEKQFFCVTPDNTYSYTWRVNRTWVSSNSTFPDVVCITSRSLSNGSTQGSLIFRARDQVNNTGIECFVSNNHHNVPQLDYNIVIQGYLSSPDVTYVMESHSVRFSWSAPFSLNITDYEPDILYYIINIITAIANTTINTTDTVYLLQSDLCLFSEYRVEIAAVNIVGMGEKYTSPVLSLEELTLSGANVLFDKNPTEISIQISTTCQEDINYIFELIPTFSEAKRIVISNSISVEQTSLTLSSSDILQNEIYKVIARVEGSTFLHQLNISTFDVQTVEITPQNDVKEFTDITCHFALGSEIKGCRIIILKKDSEVDKLINDYCEYTATREEGTTEGTISVMLPRGEYTVVVYDDEDVDIENPAYNTTIRISSSSIKPSGCVSIAERVHDISTAADTKIGSVYVAVAVLVLFILCK